ncbi:MAG: DUF1573 domain-containing protein [Chitinophagaceae bacterium]|nr:DUF1573 domain-containing protein [Chitinophagaceae bacterium]
MIGAAIHGKAQNPVAFGNHQKSITNKNSQVAAAAPEFKFFVTDDLHDYGTIPEGPKAIYEFQFINTGNAPLIITNAQASCGCTSPEFPREPILPGKKGKIKVTYATEGRPGNFTKSVYITSNAQTNDGMGHYELKIKGIVKPAKK